jgi:hypothetical protein
MWHVVYIIAFAVLAIVAIANLVRNLILLGAMPATPSAQILRRQSTVRSGNGSVPHPELLDQDGHVIREPLLVMKSISVKDAREQLDALYNGTTPPFDDAKTPALSLSGRITPI